MKQTLITGPATEPITAANVKLYTGIAGAQEDDLIASWIAAGRKLAEDFQHRAYITQVWELVLDGFPGSRLSFPRPALISVDSIKYYDTEDTEALYSSDNYFVDAVSEIGRLSLNYGAQWPTTLLRPVNSVLIRFTAGYGAATAVQDSVKDALYLYCAWRYDNRTGETDVPKAFYNLLQPDRMAIY
jgi:uncharacterized phiE125 gp8 family phage protein